jgi:3-dehydroquinate dehydratase-1
MKIIASLSDVQLAPLAQRQGAEILEIRLDLVEGNPTTQIQRCRQLSPLPVIATLRSGHEGGAFFGDPDGWFRGVAPVVPFADYIDIELRYSEFAARIRQAGKKIVASAHLADMPDLPTLFSLERELRAYGDMVKIIVTPGSEDDLIDLISFTRAIKKPISTGVMGEKFRYARAMLPFFGSEFVYCHMGTAVAAGQYSVEEFKTLMGFLAGH